MPHIYLLLLCWTKVFFQNNTFTLNKTLYLTYEFILNSIRLLWIRNCPGRSFFPFTDVNLYICFFPKVSLLLSGLIHSSFDWSVEPSANRWRLMQHCQHHDTVVTRLPWNSASCFRQLKVKKCKCSTCRWSQMWDGRTWQATLLLF